MNIREKLLMDQQGLIENGPITIVVFGDSITHGALRDENNYETVYWNLLKKKINARRNFVPVNVINAGIGGVTARRSLARLDSQVLKYEPDMVIVCFGLNDVNEEIDDYITALKTIFAKCTDIGAEVIFMTPNMLNTYVADDTEDKYRSYAAKTAEYQNSGRMDMFISSAVSVAKEMNIMVCDCYSKWKKLSETQDTTMLLANRINHPEARMHELFADSLMEIIFGDGIDTALDSSNTMYMKG